MNYSYNNLQPNMNNVVGNDYSTDESLGFKNEVKHIFESYRGASVNLTTDFGQIVSSPENRQAFVDNLCESLTTSPIFTNADIANEAFYGNYVERVSQLADNSLKEIARESAMIGYAPIVSYVPFFLKKQWISCIFKDVLMTEVPQTPIINLGFEKRFIKTLDGKEYPIPDVFYDDALMAKLNDEATGLSIKEDLIDIGDFKPGLKLINPTYIPGVVVGDKTVELTQDIHICKVQVAETGGTTHEVPCNIRVDITTHQFVKGDITYNVMNPDGKTIKETIEDTLIGRVDFKTGEVLIVSKTGKVKKVALAGKTANRFNNRSITVERRKEQLQYVMPESGPRINCAVTVEDAADAIALDKIDVVADNIDIMGSTLANFEDNHIKTFLMKSFDAQEKAGIGPHGYEKLTVSGSFNALPYDSYTSNITNWMGDVREYFERVIEALKGKLKTDKATVTVVAHPELVRFLNGNINWVFTDDTQVSGMKVDYKVGLYTTVRDRVHVVTTRYMSPDAGLMFIVIPTTNELITYKNYKHSTIIDRNYRNPLYTLTPNIMATHRTLTFEVLPVQGNLKIQGRELISPETLVRTP